MHAEILNAHSQVLNAHSELLNVRTQVLNEAYSLQRDIFLLTMKVFCVRGEELIYKQPVKGMYRFIWKTSSGIRMER